MSQQQDCDRVLLVEDDILIAMSMEDMIFDCGFKLVSTASDCVSALEHQNSCDIALVDLNLTDGCTGTSIGASLSKAGVSVIFVTANPEQVKEGVEGTVGVVTKPLFQEDMEPLLAYAQGHCRKIVAAAPKRLKVFR